MFGWAATLLAIALISALFGFGSFAPASAEVARIIFFVFIALFAIAFVLGVLHRLPQRHRDGDQHPREAR